MLSEIQINSIHALTIAEEATPILHPPTTQNTPIESTSDFLHFWDNLQTQLLLLQDEEYLDFVEKLDVEKWRHLLNSIHLVKKDAECILTNYQLVKQKTHAVQVACKSLLQEQDNLLQLSDSVHEKLNHFDRLENIARIVSAPGNVVTKNNFSDLLLQLDASLQFCEANPDYLDAPFYIQRFKSLLTRCMQLIKMHVTTELRAFQQDLYDKSVNQATWEAKFLGLTSSLKPIIRELETRAPMNKEYLGLLKECYSAYTSVRLQLWMPQVQSLMKSTDVASTPVSPISPSSPALVSLVTCLNQTYPTLQGILAGEEKLWYQLFDTGSTQLRQFLASLSAPLYQTLRPQITKSGQMDALSALIKSLYEYLGGYEVHHAEKTVTGVEHVDAAKITLDAILGIAQTRLIFVAQQFLKNEIDDLQSYVLERDVVDWLREAKRIGQGTLERGKSMSLYSIGSGEFLPTVQRTLLLLRALGGTLPPKTWSDLAGEAIEITKRSIISVSKTHISRNGSSEHVLRNADLFSIKNLLELRRGVQDSGVVGYLMGWENQDSEIIVPSMLTTFGKNVLVGSQAMQGGALKNLDDAIKSSCESWIDNCCKSIVGDLTSVTLKLNALSYTQSDAAGMKESIHVAEEAFFKNLSVLEHHLRELFVQMSDVDLDAYALLSRMLKNRVVDAYRRFYEVSQDVAALQGLDAVSQKVKAVGTESLVENVVASPLETIAPIVQD
jgi:hypothetical protein